MCGVWVWCCVGVGVREQKEPQHGLVKATIGRYLHHLYQVVIRDGREKNRVVTRAPVPASLVELPAPVSSLSVLLGGES